MSDPAKSEDDSIVLQGVALSFKSIRDCICALQRQGSTSTVEASTDPAQDEDGGDASDAPTSQGLASLPVPQAPASPPGIDTDGMAANVAGSAADFHFEPEPRVGGEVDDAEETAPIAGSMHSAGAEESDFDGRHERDPFGSALHGEAVPLDEVSIDPEFSKLIPPLSPEELAQLERHLLTEGCHDPLLVWDDGQQRILLDGHNRHEICRRHRIPYTVRTIHLSDRDTARTWILEHQLGRRNLTPEAQAYLRGKLYSSYKRQGARTDLPAGHSDQRLTTAEQLAAAHHVGEKTIRRDAQFAEQLDQLAEAVGSDIKHAVLARDAKISRADVGRLLKLDSPIRNRIVARSREGEPAARLIKEALAAAGPRERPSPTASAAWSAADAGRSAIQPEALTGATVMQTDAEESSPTTVLRSAWPESKDVSDVVEQYSVVKVIWVLAEVAQALNQVAPGEIQADTLLSIRERLEKVQLALRAHEAVYGRADRAHH